MKKKTFITVYRSIMLAIFIVAIFFGLDQYKENTFHKEIDNLIESSNLNIDSYYSAAKKLKFPIRYNSADYYIMKPDYTIIRNLNVKKNLYEIKKGDITIYSTEKAVDQTALFKNFIKDSKIVVRFNGKLLNPITSDLSNVEFYQMGKWICIGFLLIILSFLMRKSK